MLKKLLLFCIFLMPLYISASQDQVAFSTRLFHHVKTEQDYDALVNEYRGKGFKINELLDSMTYDGYTAASSFVRAQLLDQNLSTQHLQIFQVFSRILQDGADVNLGKKSIQKVLEIEVPLSPYFIQIMSGGISDARSRFEEIIRSSNLPPKVEGKNNFDNTRMNEADSESEQEDEISDELIQQANEKNAPSSIFSVKRMLITVGLVGGIAVLYKYLKQEDEKDSKELAANK